MLERDHQSAFSLPFDAMIENVYADISSAAVFTVPTGITAYPFVQLYIASPGNNTFVAIPNAKAIPSTGYSGSVPAGTTRRAFTKQLSLQLFAGMRVLIVGQMQTSGSGTLLQNFYFHYTGGIALLAT
jgi:hypothetical protein